MPAIPVIGFAAPDLVADDGSLLDEDGKDGLLDETKNLLDLDGDGNLL